MSGIARLGADSAGGQIIGGSNNVFVNGSPVARIGDPVAGHGNGPHAGPVMSSGSNSVFVNGISLCREGDEASCGHVASGSVNVSAG